MRYVEAKELKKGDLVVIDNRNKTLNGLVLEIESIDVEEANFGYRVTLKQPGFNTNFRIKQYETQHLQRYEP